MQSRVDQSRGRAAASAVFLIALGAFLFWSLGLGDEPTTPPSAAESDSRVPPTRAADSQAADRTLRAATGSDAADTGLADQPEHDATAGSGSIEVLLTDLAGHPLLAAQTPVMLLEIDAGGQPRFEQRTVSIDTPEHRRTAELAFGRARFDSVPLERTFVVTAHPERVGLLEISGGDRLTFEGPTTDGAVVQVSLSVEIRRPWIRVHVSVEDPGRPLSELVLETVDTDTGVFRVQKAPAADGWVTFVLPERFLGRQPVLRLVDGSDHDAREAFLGEVEPLSVGSSRPYYVVLRTPPILVEGTIDQSLWKLAPGRVAASRPVWPYFEWSDDGEEWQQIARSVHWIDQQHFQLRSEHRPGRRYRVLIYSGLNPVGDPIEFVAFDRSLTLTPELVEGRSNGRR